MKKTAAFTMAIAVLSLSVTAFADAAATDAGKDTATTTVTGADSYSTVLITDSSDNIVYVDQADTLFGAEVDFLLKADPAYGKYNVKLGGESITPTSTYFYVGVDAPKTGDVVMKRLQNEETNKDGTGYNIGYYTEVEANYASTYNALKVGYDGHSTYGGFDLGQNWKDMHLEGEGSLYLIFQLNDVPSYMKDSVTVFLSHDVVSNTPVNNNEQEEE